MMSKFLHLKLDPSANNHMEKFVSPLKHDQHTDEHYDSHDLQYNMDANQFKLLITCNTTAWSPSEMELL